MGQTRLGARERDATIAGLGHAGLDLGLGEVGLGIGFDKGLDGDRLVGEDGEPIADHLCEPLVDDE